MLYIVVLPVKKCYIIWEFNSLVVEPKDSILSVQILHLNTILCPSIHLPFSLHFPKICLNIIPPSTYESSKYIFLKWFSHQNSNFVCVTSQLHLEVTAISQISICVDNKVFHCAVSLICQLLRLFYSRYFCTHTLSVVLYHYYSMYTEKQHRTDFACYRGCTRIWNVLWSLVHDHLTFYLPTTTTSYTHSM